jgi:hypothetical protein
VVKIAKYVSPHGGIKPTWIADEQFHIYTKTKDSAGNSLDLVFLSGNLSFDIESLENTEEWNNWHNETLIFSFDDLKWFATPVVQVAPVVSLGTISNLDTDDTESIGWGIIKTTVNFNDGPAGSKKIMISCDTAVRGLHSYLSGATYFVAAMGRIHK